MSGSFKSVWNDGAKHHSLESIKRQEIEESCSFKEVVEVAEVESGLDTGCRGLLHSPKRGSLLDW